MAICQSCRDHPHTEQPKFCPGGTWCDCQHRARINPVYKSVEPKSETVIKLIDEEPND